MEKISVEQISKELLLFVQSNLLDSKIAITPETPFNQVGLDSMSIIEIVLFIERKFGVAISEKDLTPDSLKSIQSLSDCTFKYL